MYGSHVRSTRMFHACWSVQQDVVACCVEVWFDFIQNKFSNIFKRFTSVFVCAVQIFIQFSNVSIQFLNVFECFQTFDNIIAPLTPLEPFYDF